MTLSDWAMAGEVDFAIWLWILLEVELRGCYACLEWWPDQPRDRVGLVLREWAVSGSETKACVTTFLVLASPGFC